MSGPAELAIAAGVLVDVALKSTAVLGLGFLGVRTLRNGSAAQRHAMWACTFLALPLLPLVAAQRGPSIAIDAPWLVGLWAAGCLLSSLPLLRGLLTVGRIHAAALPDGAMSDVRHSDRITGPLTWGWWSPVILMPAGAKGWLPEHLSAALAHERAHIARRDWAVYVTVWGVSALFWFHPLVWLARRELSREAEQAADDLVLAQGFAASAYASLLLAVARAPRPVGGLGVSSSSVHHRIHAVLDRRDRSPRRWPLVVFASVCTALFLPSLGSWPTWTAPEASLTCQPPELLP